jgi:flagellar FliJ protein
MPHDTLATLLRLRAIEERVAKSALAGSLAARHQAATSAASAEAALVTEARGADPEHYARWLPRGLAERGAANQVLAEAELDADAARHTLAEAHAARRVADEAKAARDAEAAAELARKTQHALDDLSRRRLGPWE